MRYLKTLGLAAAMAMAPMAIGASTASATRLCEENREAACAKSVASGTTLKFVAEGTTSLTGPFGEVTDTCAGSTVEGSLSNAGSATETVKGGVSFLTFSECQRPITTHKATLGTLEAHKIAGKPTGMMPVTERPARRHLPSHPQFQVRTAASLSSGRGRTSTRAQHRSTCPKADHPRLEDHQWS